jgi:hypothetical protein
MTWLRAGPAINQILLQHAPMDQEIAFKNLEILGMSGKWATDPLARAMPPPNDN